LNNATRTISLAGTWSCRLDPNHRGMAEKWQDGTAAEHTVSLPGTTHTNEIGPGYAKKLIGNLTPVTNHVGSAWFWRDVELSAADCEQVVELSLERCCWETCVWVNGQAVGTRDSLVSPHEYDLSEAVRPGMNRLVVMVDNSNRKRKSADTATQMAETEELVMEGTEARRLQCGGHHTLFIGFVWNGMTGRMDLRIRPRVRMSPPRVVPDVKRCGISVACDISSDLDCPTAARLTLAARGLWDGAREHSETMELDIEPGRDLAMLSVDLADDLRLWDEHSPELYRLEATLESAHGADRHEAEFGMRELSQVGTQLAINGKCTFLRGALEKFVHPMTGYPPTDVEYWLEILGVNKAHGLNHIRFHSCCPPEAAFAAADRLGIILDIELPGCSGGEPDDATTREYLQQEALRIVETFGNHPSFCMLTMGNELLGESEKADAELQKVLMERVERCRQRDPHRWYCCTAHSYTAGRDDDFYVTAWPIRPTVAEAFRGEPLRGFRWAGGDVVDDSRFNTRRPETTSDYRDGIAGFDKPVITHEVGEWAVYPDISEAPQYTGVCKPFNLEIIREFMETKGSIGLARDFFEASGRLSLLLYKEEIESALRTPNLAGFQLLGFHDHPPQGTSTIGIVTALRKSKGLITPKRFREFCGLTVPLARLTKRTYTTEETLTADMDVSHFGPADLPNASFRWTLTCESKEVCARGVLPATDIPAGALTRVGSISANLSALATPCKLCLRVEMEGAEIANEWDCWVYPAPVAEEPADILWARAWSRELAQAVRDGGTAILELGKQQIPCAIRGCFTTLFWNPIMKRHHKSRTMGILCDPVHPALSEFPTESHTNWQWWDVIHPSMVLNLDGMSPRPEPIVRMIDSFIGNRCLGVLFEVRMGKGRLLVTSLDLSTDLAQRPAARQLRKSVLAYASSEAFDPTVTVEASEVERLIAAHQHEEPVPSRAEVYAQFDQPVTREAK